MRGFWASRKTAAVFLVLAVIAGILLGSRRSLGGLAREVENAFQNGVDGDGLSIARDLEKRGDAAYNLTVIARRYYEESRPELMAVQNAREALLSAQTPSEKARADRQLEEGVVALHDLLGQTELSEKDAKYPDRLYDEFRSRGMTIDRNGYNQKAEAYNRILEQFPASLLAALNGIRPAELYR